MSKPNPGANLCRSDPLLMLADVTRLVAEHWHLLRRKGTQVARLFLSGALCRPAAVGAHRPRVRPLDGPQQRRRALDQPPRQPGSLVPVLEPTTPTPGAKAQAKSKTSTSEPIFGSFAETGTTTPPHDRPLIEGGGSRPSTHRHRGCCRRRRLRPHRRCHRRSGVSCNSPGTVRPWSAPRW